MRIGIDMLADQSAGRTRGTGRYARGLVRELLADAQHEFILYYYEGLPHCELPFRMAGAKLRSLPHGDGLHAPIRALVDDNPDRLDLLLLTCPLENFQGYLPPFPSRRGPRLAAIVYDLIPLRFPGAYLSHPDIAASYRQALAAVRHYDLLLTISESARRDIRELLPSCSARVVNVGAASDGGFFRPPDSPPDEEAARWLKGQGIDKPFVYAITAADYRKNFDGLLAGWRLLPEAFRKRFQCVITCSGMSTSSISERQALVAGMDGCSSVVMTDALDDDHLRLLYQQATAFVFPSRYEGFGLPLLEALECGAAVLAGNNSSQREVLGDAGLLVNVDDPVAVAAQLARLLAEPQLVEELRRRALWQSRKFSWSHVGGRCLEALSEVCAGPRRLNRLPVWTARVKLALEGRWRRGTFSRRAG